VLARSLGLSDAYRAAFNAKSPTDRERTRVALDKAMAREAAKLTAQQLKRMSAGNRQTLADKVLPAMSTRQRSRIAQAFGVDNTFTDVGDALRRTGGAGIRHDVLDSIMQGWADAKAMSADTMDASDALRELSTKIINAKLSKPESHELGRRFGLKRTAASATGASVRSRVFAMLRARDATIRHAVSYGGRSAG
jgi:hypothetical protein